VALFLLLLGVDEDPQVWTILEGGIPMSLLELIVLLVIAGIAGAVAEFIVGFTPGGFLVSIILGVIGAYIGSWLAHRLHLPQLLPITVGTQTIELVWTILGALVLVGLVSLLRGRHYPRRRYTRRRLYRYR
jgi:uncharacterized membrane protein YeaQ/YmgE (transglycosylase-associated protein family)